MAKEEPEERSTNGDRQPKRQVEPNGPIQFSSVEFEFGTKGRNNFGVMEERRRSGCSILGRWTGRWWGVRQSGVVAGRWVSASALTRRKRPRPRPFRKKVLGSGYHSFKKKKSQLCSTTEGHEGRQDFNRRQTKKRAWIGLAQTKRGSREVSA